MKLNMGLADRIFRIVIAVFIGITLLTNVITGILAVLAICFAAILLITSVLGFCPLYLPFGFSTRKNRAVKI